MIESQLLRFAKKSPDFKYKLLIADTETSGLNLFFSQPFEISWLIDDKGKLEDKQFFPWFFDIKVSQEAARVNGFVYDSYKKQAIDKNIVCEELDKVLFDENNLIIWQNGLGFDSMILNNFRKLCGKKSDYSYLTRTIDTRALCMAYQLKIHPQAAVGTLDFLAWQFSLMQRPKDRKMKTSLDFMVKEFKVKCDDVIRHEASGDNILTKRCFEQLIWKVDVFI